MRRLEEIRLAERDRAAIGEAVRLLRVQFPVEEVILFGSKARGDDEPEEWPPMSSDPSWRSPERRR